MVCHLGDERDLRTGSVGIGGLAPPQMNLHLDYPSGQSKPPGQANERNGASGKTVITDRGPVRVEVPRDRDGGFDERVIAMYARGMSVREIQCSSSSRRNPVRPPACSVPSSRYATSATERDTSKRTIRITVSRFRSLLGAGGAARQLRIRARRATGRVAGAANY